MNQGNGILQDTAGLMERLANEVIDGIGETSGMELTGEWKDGLRIGILHTIIHFEEQQKMSQQSMRRPRHEY